MRETRYIYLNINHLLILFPVKKKDINKKNTYSFRHLEFGLVDTSGMSEQQRREISYTVVQSQSVQQSPLQTNNPRLDDIDSLSLPRYDDLKTVCNPHSHPPQLEDETGSVVIV